MQFMYIAIFLAISDSPEHPSWFTQGKTTLIPKPGEFRSKNQQPITCLNTIYKWFTACLFAPINYHLQRNNLMESQQRGAKSRCTTDNFLIEGMVIQDCARGNRKFSIDVKKAYDLVDQKQLSSMMALHKFPRQKHVQITCIACGIPKSRQRQRMVWKCQRRSNLKEDYLRVMLCA